MKTYIDCDSVILDTSELLFYEWKLISNYKELSEEEKIKYIQTRDWVYILNNSNIINDSLYYLKNMDYNNSAVLTKIHSFNEGIAKVNYFRDKGLKQEIILVPYKLKKTEIVNPCGNILIDDSVRNLDEWDSKNGISVFFNKDNLDYDGWGSKNTKYKKVKTLSKYME